MLMVTFVRQGHWSLNFMAWVWECRRGENMECSFQPGTTAHTAVCQYRCKHHSPDHSAGLRDSFMVLDPWVFSWACSLEL